ncbi:hypothetical protein [Peribacillus muralis]|uniref:hypothetical protein n=1 Tax=Peribacillus muralis TaxID=264697 RepID=UPI00366CDB58
MNPENMKTSMGFLKEYHLSDFLMLSFTRKSSINPQSMLNPLLENSCKFCSEDLPYKDIYKFHKVKKLVEHYQEVFIQLAGEKSKYEFLMKGSEVG